MYLDRVTNVKKQRWGKLMKGQENIWDGMKSQERFGKEFKRNSVIIQDYYLMYFSLVDFGSRS